MLSTHLRITKRMRARHYRRKEGVGTEALTVFRKIIICFFSPASNQSFALKSSTSCITSSALLCVSKE